MHTEIVGIHLPNKGDEMMLREIINKLGITHDLAVSGNMGMDVWPNDLNLQRIPVSAKMNEFQGVLTKFPARMTLRAWKRNKRSSSSNKSHNTDEVSTANIDAIIDCNGFSYSDQWGFGSSLIWRAGQYKQCRKRGGKVIMMPQAYGPFNNKHLRNAMREMMIAANVVYVRDKQSYGYIEDIVGKQEHIILSPDFTNLLGGQLPEDKEKWASRVCLVPNMRMIDKTKSVSSTAYIQFMAQCINAILDRGLEPVVLIHEDKDHLLVKPLLRTLKDEVLIADRNAVESKGILGASFAVISSRYHGLISTLSQAVPALGTAWTHKYRELFQDYNCPECLISDFDDPNLIQKKLDMLTNESTRQELIQRLEEASHQLKQKATNMWSRIQNTLIA